MSHFMLITAKSNFGGTNDCVNTWHYSADGSAIFGTTPSAKTAQANAAITQIRAFYNSLGAAGLWNAWTVGSAVIEYQTGQPPSYVTATPLTSTAGSGSVGVLQTAAVITWRTALAGKSYRGRSYIGPLFLSAYSMPLISTSFVTACNTAAATLIAAPGVGDLVPAVYSPTLDITTRITSGVSSQKCRTMRSRAE